MTTTIDTTDYIHAATGMRMRSLKTIRTESHDDWTDEALAAEHAYEVAVAEARGMIAERQHADDLFAILSNTFDDFESCLDMDSFQATYERLTKSLNEVMHPAVDIPADPQLELARAAAQQILELWWIQFPSASALTMSGKVGAVTRIILQHMRQ